VNKGSVIGLDFSTKMLSQCRKVAPSAQLQTADITLPWPVIDNAVTTVLADLVLEHIEDLDHIARESARVLRSGGSVRIAELHPKRQLEGKKARFQADGEQIEIAAYTHTTEEYIGAFIKAGFQLDTLSEPRALCDEVGRPPRLLVMEFSLKS